MQKKFTQPLAILASMIALSSSAGAVSGPPLLIDTEDSFPVYGINMIDLHWNWNYFNWEEDIGELNAGDTVLELQVAVAPGFQFLETFQVFGNCDATSEPFAALFSMTIDDVATEWTQIEEDPCHYHNYLGQELPLGDITMALIFDGIADGGAPAGPFGTAIDVRFGKILPAVPLPPALLGLGAGLAGLVELSRTRRRRTKQAT